MSRRSVSDFSKLVGCFSVCGILSATSFAGTDPLGEALSNRVASVFEQGREAVVRIESRDRHGRLTGSGFYADPSGTIYTVIGVLGDADEITVHQGMRKLPARLLMSDPRTGLALIKVDANTPFLPIGDSASVQMAAPLVAIGFPRSLPETFSFGMATGFDREYLNRYFRTTHIRASIPVQPGLGGAPVLNLDGQVVGIVVAGVEGNVGCFILPINAAEKLRTEFARFGELRPGWVGVAVEDLPASDEDRPRACVAELQEGTPAAESGIVDGDVLLKVGEIAIRTREDVIDASFFLTAGDTVPVTVMRDGEEITIAIRAMLDPAHSRENGTPVAESMPRFDLGGN